MTTAITISVVVGGLLSALGVRRLVGGLLDASKVARVLGDEFMVYAEVGTFAVGPHAMRLKETKRLGVSFLMGALLLTGYEYYHNEGALVWLIGVMVAAGSLRLATQMVPGCILVLGRSADNTLRLQETMNRALAPFRSISLLSMSKSEDELALRAHSFRLGPGSDWAGAVQTLATFMPLLVLDLRDSSDYVEEEVRIILQKGYLYKTVFVTRNRDKEPLRKRAQSLGVSYADDQVVCVSSAEECLELLRTVLLVKRVTPTPTNAIAGLHEEGSTATPTTP